MQRLTTPRLPKYCFFMPCSLLLTTALFIILAFSVRAAYAMDVTLAWDANSEADLAGYKIYYKTGTSGPPYDGEGASEGDSPINIEVEEFKKPNSPQYTIHGLSDSDTVYLTLTAFNADGKESGYSNEISLGATNQPPMARFTADPSSGGAPLVVLFDARESSDPDGAVVSYDWDFGDGTVDPDSGAIANHEYTTTGTYTVRLTVTDDLNATDAAMDTITVVQVGTSTIHLGDLAAGKKVKGKSGLWEVFVTVTVHDEACKPVSGARVVGEWSGAFSGFESVTIGRKGAATFETGTISGGDVVAFTVIEVEHDSFTYDPYANDAETTIEIFKN